MAGAHLHLYNVQFEDAGTYTCEALNSKGKDYHSARVSVEGKKYVICYLLFQPSYFKIHCREHTYSKSQSISAVFIFCSTHCEG